MGLIKLDDSSSASVLDKDKVCAPGTNFLAGSCIPLDLLVEMANSYNKNNNNNNNKIKLYKNLDTLNPKKYKNYLVKQFKDRLSDICKDQKCWVKQNFVNDLKKEMTHYLKKLTFRPSGPNGKFTWLNTLNVNNVMHQYENQYDDFKFYGAVPIDFDDLPELKIKNINFNNLEKKEKINKLGFVFNLDESWKSGSHWVALHADLKKGQVYFFDSYGIRPEKRIRALMRKMERYLREKGIKNPDIDYNKIRHQYKNSECGVYSLHFIIKMLEGNTFKNVTENIISDDNINKCRKTYFR
jgi:hypothetical protein